MYDFCDTGNKILKSLKVPTVGILITFVCLFSTGCTSSLDYRKTFVLEFQEEKIVTSKNKEKETSYPHEVQTASIDTIIRLDTEGYHCFDTCSIMIGDDDRSWNTLIPPSYIDFLNSREEKGLLERKKRLSRNTSTMVFEEDVKYDVPIMRNRKVMYFIHYFQTIKKDVFSKWLSRSHMYVPMMREILRKNNIPEDLVYLALIESGFNPKAYSRAHACGPWQFIKGTGRIYGMKINWWIDERRDPEKSTDAAARYLKDLYERFGSWYLAAAAYNAGENKIIRAINKHKTDDFWEISEYRYIKNETKNYIPKMIAGIIIAKNPERYGFGDIEYKKPLAYDKVRIPDATDLKVIARACETDYETIKALNPELRRGCTPPNFSDYRVKIPQGKRRIFEKNFAKISPQNRFTFVKHVIKRGETLSRIAILYNTRVKPIMELNKIRNPRRIRAGTNLIIPSRGRIKPKRERFAKVIEKNYFSSGRKEIVYTVRKGDTLWDIARRYELKTSEIIYWNNLRKRGTIYPGNMLKLRIKTDLDT